MIGWWGAVDIDTCSGDIVFLLRSSRVPNQHRSNFTSSANTCLRPSSSSTNTAQTAEMFICTGVVHTLPTCQTIQSSSSAHLSVLTRKGRNAPRSKGWAQGCVAFFWGPKVSAADSSGLIQKRAASASNPGRPCYLGTDQVPAGLFFPPAIVHLSKPLQTTPTFLHHYLSLSHSPPGDMALGHRVLDMQVFPISVPTKTPSLAIV
jgi:hypothetical protein